MCEVPCNPGACRKFPDSLHAQGLHAPRGGQFKKNYFTEMCSGSEEGSYLRLIDCCMGGQTGKGVDETAPSYENHLRPAREASCEDQVLDGPASGVARTRRELLVGGMGKYSWESREPLATCGEASDDLIPASIYGKYSVGPSIRPICTRCCFIITNMIQVCSNFH